MWWRKAQEDEPFFLAEDQMSVHGFLYKRGRNLVKKYKKRWFVLPDNNFSLQYYSSPHGKLLGEIDINNILNVTLHNKKKHLYGIELTTPSRVYSLYARTVEERDGWCSCLSNRLRIIATNKLREVPGQQEEDEERSQTLPKVSTTSRKSTERRDSFRHSPRRALSDGMLRANNGRLARYTPPFLEESSNESIQANETSSETTGPTLKGDTSLTLTGTSPMLTEDCRSSVHSIRARSPISISDETARFNVQDTTDTQDRMTSIAEGSNDVLDEAEATHQVQLMSKVHRLEHMVAEKDATIAALSAMLKRQSMAPDVVRFTANGVSSPPSVGKNRGVQQQLDEFVGISMWLEQKKKSELEKDVQQLKETNDELSSMLEEERQKSQYLEQEKYNMQCMIEHLEREKIKI